VSYPSASLSIRFIHRTSDQLFPRADAQDKDSINTNRTEYTKSGTDDEMAGNQEAAFDPSITSPESEKNKASEGNDGNPLDVSPANPEVSKQFGREKEGGAENSGGGDKNSGRATQSGPASAKKAQKVRASSGESRFP